MDSWTVYTWSLKTKELFLIGLVDRPRVESKNKELFRIGLMDCPCVEPKKQGVVPDWTCGLSTRGALKEGFFSRLD